MPNNRQNRGSKIIQFLKGLYLTNLFFIALGVIVVGLILTYIIQISLYIMLILIITFLVIFVLDAISINKIDGIEGFRNCPDRLSNGDFNPLYIAITNRYPFQIGVTVIEEVPFQFQKRDLIFNSTLVSGQQKIFHYDLRPTERGVYSFGNINIFVKGIFSLVSRRYVIYQEKYVAVYPSFIEMKKYELLAASHRLTEYGVKKIRRLGNATEFDHIKHYVLGDDPRTINYKATARINQLMINTYQEEKSQPVYCLIDKGRTMKMPFNGMTLLDYSINSTLMVCSTALNRGDKAGLITFSNNIDNILPADKHLASQRSKIQEMLFAQKTNFKETDYEKLYITVKRKINQRSLIMLYTNFETVSGMRRQLKYLSRLAKEHLVLVAFFLNSEFNDILTEEPEDLDEMFRKGIAEKLSNDKFLIVKELNRNGIYTVLSKPEELTINSINKYLEFKSRGLI